MLYAATGRSFPSSSSSERMTGPEPLNATERKAVLHQVFADAGWECPQILHAMDQISDVYYDRVSQIRMDGWSKGRVMLIGDAAACVSLLAGEGAGLAMTEAYVLAGELNRAGQDYQAAYRRYEQLLRPFVEGKQKSARYFASAFVPKTWVGVWLRNQATKLMAFPPLAHYFLVRQMRDDFDLPNYDVPVSPPSGIPKRTRMRPRPFSVLPQLTLEEADHESGTLISSPYFGAV